MKRRKSQRFVNGTFSVSAMKLNFMVLGLPISTKTVKEMYNEDGEAIDRAPNPMMLLTMEVTQPVAVGDMIRKKNKPAKRRSNYECPRE